MTAAATGRPALCVIPARGGSTRIPRKNVRPLAGEPLIARTIRTVLESGVADRVVVTTDDDEIADVAAAAGADVPFRRAPELADDHTPTIPVVADALARLATLDPAEYATTWVVYPTAALLRADDLRAAQQAFADASAEVAMSVIEAPGPVERAWRREAGGRGTMLHPEHAGTRTQDLPPAYFDAGQFYVAATSFWSGGRTFADASPLLVPLPRWRIVDIDTEDDWRAAECLHAALANTPENEADRLERLWSGDFGDRYLERNRHAGDGRDGFWRDIVELTGADSVLEVGSNVGANLRWIAGRASRVVGVDVNRTALEVLAAAVPDVEAVWARARALPFAAGEFDLVVTSGVLIHQPDETLGAVLAELRRCARRWILLAEYYAPSTEEVPYRGVDGALFRRDYGALMAATGDDLVLRRTGFLGRDEGWDDVTWWLFERAP